MIHIILQQKSKTKMKAYHFGIITFHPLDMFEENSFMKFSPKVFIFLMRPGETPSGPDLTRALAKRSYSLQSFCPCCFNVVGQKGFSLLSLAELSPTYITAKYRLRLGTVLNQTECRTNIVPETGDDVRQVYRSF